MEDTFHLGIKGLIRNTEGKILLLKVNPAKLKKVQEAYWDIPGGRIQRGATVEETLLREIAEEIALTELISYTPLGVVMANIRIPIGDSDVGLLLSIYECKIDEHAGITISDEHLEYGWFAPQEAAELLKIKYPIEFTDLVKSL